jgi:hypothetical protein
MNAPYVSTSSRDLLALPNSRELLEALHKEKAVLKEWPNFVKASLAASFSEERYGLVIRLRL